MGNGAMEQHYQYYCNSTSRPKSWLENSITRKDVVDSLLCVACICLSGSEDVVVTYRTIREVLLLKKKCHQGFLCRRCWIRNARRHAASPHSVYFLRLHPENALIVFIRRKHPTRFGLIFRRAFCRANRATTAGT